MQTTHLLIHDTSEVVWCGRAYNAEDVVELIKVMLPWENGAVVEHLSQDATDRPDVN